MDSLGIAEGASRNKAMWVSPKIVGAKPSERWGHSSCYFNGSLYIFGGCRGGVHFSDVLVCNLGMMTWNILKTSGQGPGPRDSHTAVVVGHQMLVFGGTNGSKKVNDLHLLDLHTREWTRPDCFGNPPSARESHTAHVVDNKLVVFGGSGEGGANYLNDLHILDLKSMEWSSPEVKGSIPAPRDSHSSAAVGSLMFVFGGDSGDRYQGDVSVLDMNQMVWSRLDSCGPSPGARAGHAAVSIGTKVYLLGGVGNKQYYNDVWVLDVITSTWSQLEICSQKYQGRFSHTATVMNTGIAIFGGCGEDERPLNELLILQLDSITSEAPKTKMFLKKEQNDTHKAIFVSDDEDLASPDVEEVQFDTEQPFCFSSDMLHPKRRRTSNSKVVHDPKSNTKDCILPRQSSPSLSEYNQIPMKKNIPGSCPSYRIHPLFRQKISSASCFLSPDGPNHIKQEQTNAACNEAFRPKCRAAAESRKNLIGAEVHGHVDGAFDSGYLMTATVNGKVFRGVLFAPGPDIAARGSGLSEYALPFAQATVSANSVQNHSSSLSNPIRVSQQLLGPAGLCRGQELQSDQSRKPSPENARANAAAADLQGVVLSLASPGSNHGTVL